MILRKEADGGLIVIGQTHHSNLVGQLAALWGNEKFARPEPYESVARAATYHDYGWLRYETSPEVDPASGEPYAFLKLPMREEQIAAYQSCVDWMNGIDPYAALMISRHRTGLWQRRYGVIEHPGGYHLTNPSPMVRAFIERNEDWQAKETAKTDPKQFLVNYSLLQVWDLLGLYFCCQEPYDDYIEPAPLGYGDANGTRLTMKALSKTKIAFDPFPFAQRPCRIQLVYKRLPQQRYADTAAFRQDYYQAAYRLFEFELV